MTTEGLLQDLETQSHSQRIREMIALGRQRDAESRAIIAELERGGFYERMLALYSCFGSRDSALILRELNDRSRMLRGLATQLAALICDDDEALRALEDASPSMRLALARKLRNQRRSAVTDAWLERQAPNSATILAILPFGSSETVTQLAPHLPQFVSTEDWRRLVRAHPALAARLLETQIGATTESDGRLLRRLNEGLPLLVAAAPDAALSLVASMRRLTPLKYIRCETLADRRAAAVADLILSESSGEERLWTGLGKRVTQLSTEQIMALYRRNQHIFGWNMEWFKRLTLQRRAEVFAGLEPLWRDGDTLPADILGALPTAEREREARKAVGETRVTLKQRLRSATYLPWDEARAVLDPNLRASDAEIRQAALAALIGAVAYHRSHMKEALAAVHERRNEQDGTRRVMLSALRTLPLGVWSGERLPTLGEIIRHGLNDVSLSTATLVEIVRLLLKLLPSYPDWASEQLVQIMRERGWTISARSWEPLSPAAELRLAQAMSPLISDWTARDNNAKILEVTGQLLTRPTAFALTADALEGILRRTRSRHNAERALALLHERARTRFERIVPELLASDASWITFPRISEHLMRRRQDLLSPYLAWQEYRGRWDTERERFLPSLQAPLIGGTATQQERYADAAMALATDGTQDSHATTDAIERLALLPAIPAARLATLANDSRSVARTTAIFALSRREDPDGLPTLLAALEDDRAGVAIHALRRFLVAMPTQQALDVLRGVSLDRVTVAKEVVRLVGKLEPDAAYAELLAYAARDLHRDVRIALLYTLGAFLDRTQTWHILEQATRSPQRDIALAPLSLTPLGNAATLATQEDPQTQQRTLRLLATLIAHPDAEVRTKGLFYCGHLGIPDKERTLTPSLVEHLEMRIATAHERAEYDEALYTATAFFGVCAPGDEDAARRVVQALLPHRRLLQGATSSLRRAPRLRERRLLPIVWAAINTLAQDQLTVNLRIDLAVNRLPAAQLGAFLTDLARTGELHAGALAHAVYRLNDVRNRDDAQDVYELEESLSVSEDERLRRVGLAILVSRADAERTWSAKLLERLRAYRADRSALVASAAQFVIPDEDDPGV